MTHDTCKQTHPGGPNSVCDSWTSPAPRAKRPIKAEQPTGRIVDQLGGLRDRDLQLRGNFSLENSSFQEELLQLALFGADRIFHPY
jgi:hypothetical protein